MPPRRGFDVYGRKIRPRLKMSCGVCAIIPMILAFVSGRYPCNGLLSSGRWRHQRVGRTGDGLGIADWGRQSAMMLQAGRCEWSVCLALTSRVVMQLIGLEPCTYYRGFKRGSRGSGSSDDLVRSFRNRCPHPDPCGFSASRITSSGGLFAAARPSSTPQSAFPTGRQSVVVLAEVRVAEVEAVAAYVFSSQHHLKFFQ